MSMVIGKNYVKPIDKDVALAGEITKAWFEGRCPEIEGGSLASVHSNPQYILSSYIEYALTTVRKEAREAAFKELIDAARVENAPYNAGREYAKGFARAKKTIIGKIEAAASTEEGSNHATKA